MAGRPRTTPMMANQGATLTRTSITLSGNVGRLFVKKDSIWDPRDPPEVELEVTLWTEVFLVVDLVFLTLGIISFYTFVRIFSVL